MLAVSGVAPPLCLRLMVQVSPVAVAEGGRGGGGLSWSRLHDLWVGDGDGEPATEGTDRFVMLRFWYTMFDVTVSFLPRKGSV